MPSQKGIRMEKKQCSKCKRFLPKSDFYEDSKGKNGLRSNCKRCVADQGKQYRKNPLVYQQRNQKTKEWCTRNRKRVQKIRRRAQAKWRADNLERAREADRISQAKNKANNPDKWKVKDANRRAKKVGVKGIIAEDEWAALRKSQNEVCPCCGEIAKLEMDHINPLCKGGPNLIENIQPLCRPCNSKKNRRTMRYI